MNSRLYVGRVMHARLRPVRHAFAYPAYVYCLDLDELPELDRAVRGFGYNRFALASVRDRDYLRGEGTIRDRILREFEARGCAGGIARIELVTSARFLGLGFNPVSFYHAFRADGSLRCAAAEVNNTFGERHLYVLDQPVGDPAAYPVTFRPPKQFHVSPFNPMPGWYEIVLDRLGDEMRIRVDLWRDEGRIMEATLTGRARPLDSANLRRTILAHPFAALITMPRIVAQAARLRWRRKLPVYTKPPPSHAMTIRAAPPSPWQAFCLRQFLRVLSRLRHGRIRLVLPDGAEREFGDPAAPAQTLRARDYGLFTRTVAGGDIGFGESFTAGEWDADDLAGLIRTLIRNLDALGREAARFSHLSQLANRLRHRLRANTPAGSRRNIEAHYDLGNDFYRLFLDPETMLYSCAIFEAPGQSLAEAQRAKLRRILDLAEIRPGDHVLEIGCGWGGFAVEAARRTGGRVTGVTVSPAQLELARARVREAGLEDRVTLELRDYRDLEGAFDRIVSIEMLEAVGHEYLDAFFAVCARVLKPGGRMVVQVITAPDERYETYLRNPDWIQKHIFPGGHLPCRRVLDAAARRAGLALDQTHSIGPHYALTLRAWRERLLAARDRVRALGFDEAFLRTWDYYFSYCEAGFATGHIDNLLLVFSRPAP